MSSSGEVYRAGHPVLGARLLAAAHMVPPHSAVADIGCDHGKLAVWLALKGKAAKVVAVDSRPLPLAGAKALVQQTGTANVVDCRLGEGLCALAPNEVSEIVIAGLSAETIAGILEQHQWVFSADVHLVLVPATRHAWLRRWLCQQGFAIEKEAPVQEKGRAYTVISARYNGRCHTPDALFCQLGLVPQSEDRQAVRAYATARLRDLRKRADGLSGEALRAHNQLIHEVEQCLQ